MDVVVTRPDRSGTDPAPSRRVVDVQRALGQAVSLAHGYGAPKKLFLVGLWQAFVGCLAGMAGPDHLTGLADMFDERALVLADGLVDDAPSPKGETRERILAEASLAARAVVDTLDTFVSGLDDDAQDTFPDDLADAALAVLKEGWGPSRLRRMLGDQADSFRSGRPDPVLPPDPRAKPPRKAVPEMPVPRTVEVHLDAEAVPGGRVLSAYLVDVHHGPARHETREVTTAVPGDDVRRAGLLACAEALRCVSPLSASDTLRIVGRSALLVEGATDRSRRRPVDAAEWDEIEAYVSCCPVVWTAGETPPAPLTRRVADLVAARARPLLAEVA